MRSLASGVSLITHGAGPEMTGMTATSVTALSADPPTLIVCVNRSASLYVGLRRDATFGVNLLAADHQPIADRFAGRTGAKGRERFVDPGWVTTEYGAPLLVGALAALECEVEETIERHTHVIVIGRVKRIMSSCIRRGARLLAGRLRSARLGQRRARARYRGHASAGVSTRSLSSAFRSECPSSRISASVRLSSTLESASRACCIISRTEHSRSSSQSAHGR